MFRKVWKSFLNFFIEGKCKKKGKQCMTSVNTPLKVHICFRKFDFTDVGNVREKSDEHRQTFSNCDVKCRQLFTPKLELEGRNFHENRR